MKLRTGQLIEISPWGTGFIEDEGGARFGFHYSMIKNREFPVDANWPETLRDRPVQFKETDGVVVEVLLRAIPESGKSEKAELAIANKKATA